MDYSIIIPVYNEQKALPVLIDRLYKNIPKIIPKYTFSDKVRNKVLKNKHGDSSGVRGAAWLWNE